MHESQVVHITSQEAEERMLAMRECWRTFVSKMTELYNEENDMKVEPGQYEVNVEALHEIVDRVYLRDDYFRRYHSGMKMSEYKEIGLNMFWIVKLKPFSVEGKGFDEKFAFDINQEFAMYYLFVALEKLADIQKKKYNSDRITRALYDELLYSLVFRDISKEALGLIVELVAQIVIFD